MACAGVYTKMAAMVFGTMRVLTRIMKILVVKPNRVHPGWFTLYDGKKAVASSTSSLHAQAACDALNRQQLERILATLHPTIKRAIAY